MNRGGRPSHNEYDKLGFIKVESKDGMRAYCKNAKCEYSRMGSKGPLKNTGIQRLTRHRYKLLVIDLQ